MCMQHITTLQDQGLYVKSANTTQHKLIAHRKGRAERNSPARLPCPVVIISALGPTDMGVWTEGKPLDKLKYRQGRADSNSPYRSELCPAIIMCQNNTTVSLHVHAACYSTVSSGTV